MQAAAWLVPVLALLLPGCPPTATPPPAGYFGPTQSLYEVVTEINQNNRQLPTLWARHYFEAYIVDETGRRQFVNGEGILLYRRPGEMRLVGRKDLAGQIFEIGSTQDRFWLQVIPEMDTMWWGHYRNVGRACAQNIPIRPDLIIEVLGIETISENFLADPAPVMRFNNDADSYMFVWTITGPDRRLAQKEIWYDRQTKRPNLVLLFDADGRIILRAYLSNHQPVEVPDLPREQWPIVATDYRLFFPDTGTSMHFELTDQTLTSRGVPRAGSITFPDRPPVGNVIQIDADCD